MQRVSKYALRGLGVAALVSILKAAAYQLTGSVALFSDALESIINLLVAFAAIAAIRVSRQPADDNHPFGHHKAEYFSAVLEGVLIVVAALAIFWQAAHYLVQPVSLTGSGVGIAVNAVALGINAVWGWRLARVGERERSPALLADAKHVQADAAASAGVILGVAAADLTGRMSLDAVAAFGVGIYILFSGWRLLQSSVGGLMDEAASAETLKRIETSIEAAAQGAIEAHDLKTRHAGPVTFIEFHLVVPGGMTVAAAHEICDRIENALSVAVPGARIAIHVEPEEKAKHAGLPLSGGTTSETRPR